MKGSYSGSAAASRAIYPTHEGRLNWFVVLLVACKVCHAFGLFLIYDALKVLHVVQFLCIIKLLAGVVFVAAQRPLVHSASSKRLREGEWLQIVGHALLGSLLNLLWLYGLSLCGPLRSVLVAEHYDFVVVAGLGAFVTGVSSPTKVRGVVFFGLALLALLLFDHDEGAVVSGANSVPSDGAVEKAQVQEHHPEGQQHFGISHVFYYLLAWMGLADHKGGVILLFLVLLLNVGFNALGRRISAEVGGTKKLQALSTLTSGCLLLPWALLIYFSQPATQSSNQVSVLILVYAAFFSFVLPFYIDSICAQRLELPLASRVGSTAIFLSALALSWWWQAPNWDDHALSGGVIFSCCTFIMAVLSLTSRSRSGTKGSFVGYSAAGLPLYNFTTDALQQTSQSLALFAKSGLKQILSNANSRKIFYFLCLNLGFTMVEFMYGFWTNSLGLISDGFHMLFDCSALVLGLYAAVMSRWKPSKTFSFGYSRVEVLSGFVNGLFLLVVSVCVFWEGLSRLLDPPNINTNRLVAVSVAGLCVNLVGILAFRNSTGAGHHHHGHGHSHSSHMHSHNINMEGVFLHMVADTLGSVGVIVSSVVIEQLGWLWADPVCSLFISTLIFLSVLPLLQESSLVLLLRVPHNSQKSLQDALQAVLSLQGVRGWRLPRFWTHSQDILAGSLHVQLEEDASEQKVIRQVAALFQTLGFKHFTVQAEKEPFFMHLSGLGSHSQLLHNHSVGGFSAASQSTAASLIVNAI